MSEPLPIYRRDLLNININYWSLTIVESIDQSLQLSLSL